MICFGVLGCLKARLELKLDIGSCLDGSGAQVLQIVTQSSKSGGFDNLLFEALLNTVGVRPNQRGSKLIDD